MLVESMTENNVRNIGDYSDGFTSGAAFIGAFLSNNGLVSQDKIKLCFVITARELSQAISEYKKILEKKNKNKSKKNNK